MAKTAKIFARVVNSVATGTYTVPAAKHAIVNIFADGGSCEIKVNGTVAAYTGSLPGTQNGMVLPSGTTFALASAQCAIATGFEFDN